MLKQTAFRIPEDTLQKLDEMATIMGTDRTTYINMLINQEYDKYEGSPKMKKALEALRQCQEIIRKAGLIDEVQDCKLVIEKTPKTKKVGRPKAKDIEPS